MPSSDGEVPAIGQMILACLLQTKLDGQSATVHLLFFEVCYLSIVFILIL